MQLPSWSWALWLFATGVSAAACNADNCLRAVRASQNPAFSGTASSDCSAFLMKTLIPCAATSTLLQTITVTGAPSTVTATVTSVVVVDSTVVVPQSSIVTTIVDTATIVIPSQVVQTVVNVLPTTVTAQAQAQTQVARDVKTVATTGAICSTVGGGSDVTTPRYASVCGGAARYTSACSCIGITAAPSTTAPRVTTTVTSVVTVTVTPTVTATAVIAQTSIVINNQTSLVPLTLETTAATVVVPSLYTSTATYTSFSTVVVAPPVCSTYIIKSTANSPTIPNRFVITFGRTSGYFTYDSFNPMYPSEVTVGGNTLYTLNGVPISCALDYPDGYGSNIFPSYANDHLGSAGRVGPMFCSTSPSPEGPGQLSLDCICPGKTVSGFIAPGSGEGAAAILGGRGNALYLKLVPYC